MPALARAGSCKSARSAPLGQTVDRQSRDVLRQVYYAALSSAFVRGLRRLSALVLTAAGLWCTTRLLHFVFGPDGRRRGANPDLALPLCAIGLLAVPYLPWLPDRLPALRAAAGPARYLLCLVIAWLVICRAFAGPRLRSRP